MQETVDKETFLSEPNVAILATTGPGKRAHAVPVWYLYEDGRFIMSAGATSQKVRNIERQGEAIHGANRPRDARVVHLEIVDLQQRRHDGYNVNVSR